MKKRYRIKNNETIKSVLNHRKSYHDGTFSVFIKPNALTHFRYGLSVPKAFGSAVARNRIKRQLRMIIAQLEIDVAYDVFIIVKPKAKALTYHDMSNQLQKLMKKHKLI